MRLSSKNKSGEYFWYLIIVVLIICIGVFVYKIHNQKNMVQNDTVDNKSSQSSSETSTNKDNTKLNYVVNSNNTFMSSVPSKEKDPQNYQKIHYDVVRVLVEDGFTESDINYDEGISYKIVKDNKLVGYKMEWSIPTKCKLAMKYDSNYKLEYSRIRCR